MAAPRNRWQLRYRGTAGTDTFPSQRKAYEFIRDLARSYAADPGSMDPRVFVFVDERDGRGWCSYENLMLTDVVPLGRDVPKEPMGPFADLTAVQRQQIRATHADAKVRAAGKPRGHCPVCSDSHRLTKTGKVWRHGSKQAGVWPPQDCDGSGKPPNAR